jgi:hypothetical protein
MQLGKSWSDTVRDARAAREVERRSTPAGYPTNRGPYIPVLNLNAPGVFAALNTTGTPAAQLSPPAKSPAVINSQSGAQQYAPGLWSSINPRTAPTNASAVIGRGGYMAADPYRNTNAGYWSDMQMGSYQGSELGDFLTDLSQAITAGASAYMKVDAAQALAQTGVNPIGYSVYGTPIYQSTPAGVTPQYGSMVPSGLVLPPGVTPSYPYPVGFVQQSGVSGAYQIQPPGAISKAGALLPVLAIGGVALVLFALMK